LRTEALTFDLNKWSKASNVLFPNRLKLNCNGSAWHACQRIHDNAAKQGCRLHLNVSFDNWTLYNQGSNSAGAVRTN